MYRFLLRPKWILSHLLVLTLIIVMINLCLWQVRRLDEKKDRNALIVSQTKIAPVSVADLASLGPHQVEYRQVTMTGRYDTSKEVAVKNRTFNGAPGRDLVTPLVPSDGGRAILVLRGWMPQAVTDVTAPFDDVAPPAGPVTVTGWLMPTEPVPALGHENPFISDSEVSRLAIREIAKRRAIDTGDVYLQMESQTPASASSRLTLVPLPELDEGPHFSYAVQWAIFSAIAAGGYLLILRKMARQPYHATGEVAERS